MLPYHFWTRMQVCKILFILCSHTSVHKRTLPGSRVWNAVDGKSLWWLFKVFPEFNFSPVGQSFSELWEKENFLWKCMYTLFEVNMNCRNRLKYSRVQYYMQCIPWNIVNVKLYLNGILKFKWSSNKVCKNSYTLFKKVFLKFPKYYFQLMGIF